jgi:hypothetical protein
VTSTPETELSDPPASENRDLFSRNGGMLLEKLVVLATVHPRVTRIQPVACEHPNTVKMTLFAFFLECCRSDNFRN